MSAIQEVLNNLPRKVVSNQGCNYYLTIKADDTEGGFTAYYGDKINNDKVSERWFHEEETQPEFKIDEMKYELKELGFKVLILDVKRSDSKSVAKI